jgi:type IV pilus secretin PilQ/predicted competence protein
MTVIRGLLILLTLFVGGAGLARAADPLAGPLELKDVKIEQRGTALAITLATSGQPRYEATLLDSPVRLVIDVNGTFTAARSRWTTVPEPVVEMRGSQFKPGTARLVLALDRKVSYKIEEKPHGLTVLIDGSAPGAPGAAAATAAVAAPAAVPAPKRVAAALPDLPRMPEVVKVSDAPRTALPKPVDGGERRVALAPITTTGPTAPVTIASRVPQPVRVASAAPILVAQASSAPAPVVPSPTAPAPAAPNGSRLITLEFKDADVVNLLRILSAESGRNIVAGDDVKGKLSVSLRNVTWEQALDTILEVKGLQRVDRGGVIRIVSTEQLAREREALARAEEAKRKAEIDTRTKEAEAQLKEAEVSNRKLQAELAAAEAQARGPLKEEVIRLSYADPDDVAKTLQGILGIPAEGTQPITGTPGIAAPNGPPLIAEPPFSALYGLGLQQQQQQRPVQVVSVSQDVLAKGLTIRANKATNSIFLRLYAADLDRIKRLVREYLDVPLPQVKIEARMEILDRTALEAIGIQWGGAGAGNVGRATVVGQGFQSPLQLPGTGVTNVNPVNPNLNLGGLLPIFPDTALPLGGNLVNLPISALPNAANVLPAGGIAFGIVGTNWNINLALQALATQGKTRTLARPEIVTVENNKAEISLGEEIPYATVSSAGTQIQFKEALLKLATTPTVIRTRVDGREDTKIKLVVVVENNSRGDVVNLGTSGSPPAINKRKADTLVLLNEGERLVIGGVTQTVNQNTVRKVPYLGDIPFLGWAFKQKENFESGRELVVFLTPSVLRGMTTSQVVPPR